MRSVLPGVLVAALAAAAVFCTSGRRVAEVPAPGLDRKLSAFAFIEEGEIGTFIVDTRSTRERENHGFVPFEICVANRGLRNMSVTRESFTLVDQDGNRYPCASPREILDGYEFLDFDRRLSEVAEITFNRFAAFTRYASQFSPVREVSSQPFGSTIVRDAVSIPKFGYIIDFIYFPTPKGGVMGRRFEMFLDTPELPSPLFVKFVVQ